MKRNKEIKVGDKIWLYSACISRDSYYVVKSVKKNKTLVTVVVDVKGRAYHNDYEIIMYGHASSSLLSGYDRKFYNSELCYTCEYFLIEKETKRYERDQRFKNAGMALLNLVKYLK